MIEEVTEQKTTMLKKLVHRLLRHRHFWREVEFDELSEVYVSMMFRGLSISLTNIFVPLYMLKIGYPLFDVIGLQVWYFVFRSAFFDLLSGYLVCKIGPKHTIAWGYLLSIISTILFLTLPHVHWPLWLVGGIWGGSSSLFCIPFHVDFSKIKHREHGGKELGYVNIMEKFGGIVGPLVGGLVATLFGGQYIFLVAIFMLLMSIWPLLRTNEPVALNQPLNLRSLPFRDIKQDLSSFIANSIDLIMSGYIWALYLGLFVLTSGAAYAKLGFLASVSVITSMLAAFSIGRLIDSHHGRQLLRFGTISNALLYLFRPFTNTYPVALGINIINEGLTASYHMPYTKGMYDAADELPGHRTAYLVVMELVGSIAKLIACLSLLLLAAFLTNRSVLTIGFLLGAVASLLIMTERFKALDARDPLDKTN